jgi:hypothetical protein
MVRIKYTDFEIEEVTHVENEEWYTYASCAIKEQTKKWLIIPHVVVYELDTLLLLVCSKNLKQDDIQDSLPVEFEKRLQLDVFDAANIEDFFTEKIKEASKSDSVQEAFAYLDKWFVIDK